MNAPLQSFDGVDFFVIAAITDGVKEGRYAPGQRLVEADLTSQLGISFLSDGIYRTPSCGCEGGCNI